MDDSEHPHKFAASSSTPIIHNFLQLPPIANPDCIHELGGKAVHSCDRIMEAQREKLELFWQQQTLELDDVSNSMKHMLPLSRIRRLMKVDENVKMVSAESLILLSKACELFIMELTLRSWTVVEEYRGETIQNCDIASAVHHAERLEFLADVVSKNKMKRSRGNDGEIDDEIAKVLNAQNGGSYFVNE